MSVPRPLLRVAATTPSYGGSNRLSILLCVLITFSLRVRPASLQDNVPSYWASVLETMKGAYAGKNGHPMLLNEERQRVADPLRLEVIQRLKGDPSLAEQVRKSLRNDERIWVRAFCAVCLVKAFQQAGAADEICILSDPDPDVRDCAVMAIDVYKIQGAAASLPAVLVHKDPFERACAIGGIRHLLGWKGLPYYADSLYDSNTDVAAEAAKAFRTCKKEDALPHLLRYLRKFGKSNAKKDVTKSVINSLCQLHGEPIKENLNLKRAVDEWVERLEKETK